MDLKKRIKDLGFTTSMLAEKLGVSQPAISQAINGNPSLSRLQEIAAAMNVTLSELLSEDGTTTTDDSRVTIRCPYCGGVLEVVKHDEFSE